MPEVLLAPSNHGQRSPARPAGKTIERRAPRRKHERARDDEEKTSVVRSEKREAKKKNNTVHTISLYRIKSERGGVK